MLWLYFYYDLLKHCLSARSWKLWVGVTDVLMHKSTCSSIQSCFSLTSFALYADFDMMIWDTHQISTRRIHTTNDTRPCDTWNIQETRTAGEPVVPNDLKCCYCNAQRLWPLRKKTEHLKFLFWGIALGCIQEPDPLCWKQNRNQTI